MISYGKQCLDKDDIDALNEVLMGDWLTQGPKVEEFENHLNDYFGSKYACVVSSGTAALHLASLALGWGENDIVVTTPISFLATANCIAYAGATPEFADINSKTYTLDPNLVEHKIKNYQSKGKKVKAIIGVDYAGHPCDWKALREIADKYSLQLVNDNCHAMGASYYGDKQYAIKYADIVTQSYHPVKHITTGEGGALLTNNALIAEKIGQLRNHGMTKNPNKLEKNDGPWYYEMHELGYNYRLTDFQCALGSSQLKKLDDFVGKRTKCAKRYDKFFSNSDYFKTPLTKKSITHSYHLYPLQIEFERLSLSKAEFFIRMKESGINLQVHYIPIHLQPFYRKNYKFKIGDLPISEEFYTKAISLPVFPSLKKNNMSKVKKEIFNLLP